MTEESKLLLFDGLYFFQRRCLFVCMYVYVCIHNVCVCLFVCLIDWLFVCLHWHVFLLHSTAHRDAGTTDTSNFWDRSTKNHTSNPLLMAKEVALVARPGDRCSPTGRLAGVIYFSILQALN